MDVEELMQQDRPAIIHWKHNHWVVFCGLNDAGIPVIINPDRGRFAVPVSSFKTFYTGVAIFNGDPQWL